MECIYNDGGRLAAGFKGVAGDCVTRSISIVTGLPYAEVYAHVAKQTGAQRSGKRGKRAASARYGVNTDRKWFKNYMASLGFRWTPTMGIGTGCKVHLRADELPLGRLVVAVSRHYTAVIDGVIHDVFNPSERDTTFYPKNTPPELLPKGAYLLSNGNGWAYLPQRCVYGYWTLEVSA